MIGLLVKIFSIFKLIIGNILSFIYDIIVSRPVTSYTYSRFLHRLKEHDIEKMSNLLDIGVGTGTALNYIIPEIPNKIQILGVDIDENYVTTCKNLFKTNRNVEIRLKNFLKMDDESNKETFDIILFSSSFMLMPDKDLALEIAKKLLKKNGKIYFILTLFERKKKIVEKFKPLLKYILTIDFGEALTETQFFEILQKNKIKVTYKERIHRKLFPCFSLFRYFLVEGII